MLRPNSRSGIIDDFQTVLEIYRLGEIDLFSKDRDGKYTYPYGYPKYRGNVTYKLCNVINSCEIEIFFLSFRTTSLNAPSFGLEPPQRGVSSSTPREGDGRVDEIEIAM